MKTPVLLILAAVLLAVALAGAGARQFAIPETQPLAQTGQNSGGPNSPAFQTLIEPGLSVGPLKLGDTRDRALQLFPRKDEDQEWEDKCGTTLYWVDTDNRNGRGDLTIHLKKDKVFQIESSTTRFHTAEGITTFDPPEKVKGAYKDLLAYALLTAPTPALGDRPLVFWLDKKNGIAFALAYYPAQHKRYVYKIIVFAPNKTFCPEGEKTDSPKWQQIPPYSLELPSDLAMNRQ
ncbi:MAG: hypothetical protein ABSE40_13125 [Candidatus Sulfotelmatobacter sp.]|jgi:hypothetical protein